MSRVPGFVPPLAALSGIAAFAGIAWSLRVPDATFDLPSCVGRVAPLYADAGEARLHIAEVICEEMLRDPAPHFPRSHADDPDGALTALGHLDADGVDDLLTIRRAIVEVSPEACEELWLGGDGSAVRRALALLPDETLRRFARVTVAMVRDADGTSRVRMTPDEATERFESLVETIAEDADEDVADALESDDPIDPCLATRSVLDAIELLPAEEREDAARAWFIAGIR